jgi:hypothetical protein
MVKIVKPPPVSRVDVTSLLCGFWLKYDRVLRRGKFQIMDEC